MENFDPVRHLIINRQHKMKSRILLLKRNRTSGREGERPDCRLESRVTSLSLSLLSPPWWCFQLSVSLGFLFFVLFPRVFFFDQKFRILTLKTEFLSLLFYCCFAMKLGVRQGVLDLPFWLKIIDVQGLLGQVPCLAADKQSPNLTFIFKSLI